MSLLLPFTPMTRGLCLRCTLGIFLILCSCRSLPPPCSDQTPAPKLTALQEEKDFKKRWYLAQKNPDVYCPVGFKFNTTSQKSFMLGAATFECISVADGSLRFYIPDDARAGEFRKEALAYREASKSIPLKTREKLSATSDGLMSAILTTIAVMVSGPPR